MIQHQAVTIITESLKNDPLVKAVFLKGSFGRGEEDEHSDIDLYVLVEEQDVEPFLLKRHDHLRTYREILFEDDIYIIAPQLIVVFDNLIHIDLFTVSSQAFPGKDFFNVLYDPEERMSAFKETQTLAISEEQVHDHVIDIVWFLFQYKKSASRGNDLWSVKMLTNTMEHLTAALLSRYVPERAQLGLKTAERSLPRPLLLRVRTIYENLTPANHRAASMAICELVSDESEYLFQVRESAPSLKPFYQQIAESLSCEDKMVP